MKPASEVLDGANFNDFSELTNNTLPTGNQSNTAVSQIANQMVKNGALPIKKRPVPASFTDKLPIKKRPVPASFTDKLPIKKRHVFDCSTPRSKNATIADNRLPISKRFISSVETNSQVYTLKEFKSIYGKVAITVPNSQKSIRSLINSNSFSSNSIMSSAAIREATLRYVYVRSQEMGISVMDKDKSQFKELIVSSWRELAKKGT